MDIKELVQRAQIKANADKAQMAEPFFIKTIAWLHYLGLLRHNAIKPFRYRVTLDEALKAGEFEPRIMELIPAIMVIMPKAFRFDLKKLPMDLAAVVKDIRDRNEGTAFRNVPVHAYRHWLTALAMDIAKRRLNFRKVPRRRVASTHSIGDFIRQGRLALALTQCQLAKKYRVSLRIVRDLEQGKLDASIKATNEILAVFGTRLRA